MSIEQSRVYKSERMIPADYRQRKLFACLLESTMSSISFSDFPLTTEKVHTIKPIPLVADMQTSYKSRLDHGHAQTASMEIKSDDDSMKLNLATDPGTNGLWRTVDGNLHPSDQVAKHFLELLPTEAARCALYDIAEPTAADMHHALEEAPRILGGSARYLVEYTSHDIGSYADYDLPRFDSSASLAIGSLTTLSGKEASSQNYARLTAPYETDSGTVEYSQFVVSKDDSSRVGIRITGNTPEVVAYSESMVNEKVISNLLARLEDITEEARATSSLRWRNNSNS